MNRPFEFRAYHQPTNTLFDVVIFGPAYFFAKDSLIPYPVSECVLMQFTGLYDSQGKKVFEGDIIYSYFAGNTKEPSREYWRLVAYRSAGFCELARVDDRPDSVETLWLSEVSAAIYGERLPDRVVGCYYERPDLLDLNAKYGNHVPVSFD